MAGSSTSTSQNTSSSQSETRVLDYPERAFLDSIAQYAGQVGQNVYNWAQEAYTKNSALTDANISNYLNTSSRALTQEGALNDRYNNVINPEINNQLREADNYASRDRQLMDMGAAESGQMQGGEAALANHKRDLQSFGIDPSAGRYAGLDEAAKVSSAAAAVGAAQQARQFDVTTGQNLRQAGINNASSAAVAQNAGAINDLNTALQGYAGAENAGLANANTGVALQGAANPFLSTAMNYKPITGTFSKSQSQGTSQSSSVSSDPASSGGSGSQKSPSQSGGSGGYPSAIQSGTSPYGGGSSGGSSGGSGGGDDSLGNGEYGYGGEGGDVWSGGSDPYSGGYSGDNGLGGGDTSTDPYTSAYPTDSIGGSYDPTSEASLGGYDSGGWGDSGGGGGGDLGAYDSGGGYQDFAEGGPIEDDDTSAIPEDGGVIPESASPSHGAVTDDIPAQLPSGKQINVNAREFVIPEDVARWKGEEFFQKLIAQSRQARVTAPARPTMGRANG